MSHRFPPLPRPNLRKQTLAAVGHILPSAPLRASSDPRHTEIAYRALPSDYAWGGAGTRATLRQILLDTQTRAFVVLHEGRIVHEWYDAQTSVSTRLSSWSMAKSLVSVVLGRAIGEGKIHLTDKIVDLLPGLNTGGTAYDSVIVQQLVDMTSGIDIPEGYDATIDSPRSFLYNFQGTPLLYGTPDLRSYVNAHRSVAFTPGSRGAYTSGNSQILSMLLSKVYGRPFVDLVREKVWEPAKSRNEATWNLDRPARLGGTAKGFCGLNATARDFALLGHLVYANDHVVSPAWRRRIFTPQPLIPMEDYHYSAGFWHILATPEDVGVEQDDAMMVGVFGQMTYVNQNTGTVIVKLGTDNILIPTIKEQLRAFRTMSMWLSA